MMPKQRAWNLILLLGIVSLFADFSYESARSITGPFLAILGASGALVGTVMGLGELIGYSFRLLFGALADRTQLYWPLTVAGYALSLLAAPLLAWAGSWQIAVLFILLERLGKAIRTPARDAMLASATKEIGRGKGFGVHEALDQIGAVFGPLLVSAVLLTQHSYRFAFSLLFIPGGISLITLFLARRKFPDPRSLERTTPSLYSKGLQRAFWVYLVGIGLIAAGYVDFGLIAYHFHQKEIVAAPWIPFFYALAMAVQGLSALILGKYYDQKGLFILIIATLLAAMFPPLVFLGSFSGVLTGMVLFGIGLGAQESLFRAHIAHLIPPEKRGTSYGIMHLLFGSCWFLGSALMGILYDIQPLYLVLFSVLLQISALPVFFSLQKKQLK